MFLATEQWKQSVDQLTLITYVSGTTEPQFAIRIFINELVMTDRTAVLWDCHG